MPAETGISIARRSEASINAAYAVARQLGCRWVRQAVIPALVRPDSPSQTPVYTVVDELAQRAAAEGMKVSLMMGQAPWPYGTAAGSSLTSWGWYTAFPNAQDGTGTGFNRWGAATGGTHASQNTVSYGIGPYSTSGAVDPFGSNWRFRIPSDAWDAWAELWSLIAARYHATYTAAGGRAQDIILEFANENSGPGQYDPHWVAYHNYVVRRLVIPQGVRLATDASYGHYNQQRHSQELAAHRTFWADTLSRVDFSRYDLVNLHAYYFFGVGGRGPVHGYYADRFVERVEDTLGFLRSRPELAGKGYILTEFGLTKDAIDVLKETPRGLVLGEIWERLRALPFEAVMLWAANADDGVYSVVNDSVAPVGHLAELYRSKGLPVLNAAGREPALDAAYAVGPNEGAPVGSPVDPTPA